jgi:hypothetical protein
MWDIFCKFAGLISQMKMKKLFLMSAVTLLAVACSNGKTEVQEEEKRDSIDNVQVDENQRFVDSLEKADEAKRSADGIMKDSAGHEGHDHSGHSH